MPCFYTWFVKEIKKVKLKGLVGFLRVFVLIINGLGVGEFEGTLNSSPINSFVDVNNKIKMHLPNLEAMGLHHVAGLPMYDKPSNLGVYGKLKKENNGKNMIYDYLEFFGNTKKEPLLNLQLGFSKKEFKRLQNKLKLQFIGNVHLEHSKALLLHGEEHIKTGRPILYFSGGNTLNIAGNISIITKARLHEICEQVTKQLKLNYGITKVVARPFGGVTGSFYRLNEKQAFTFKPKQKMLISHLAKKSKVILLSNISDLFDVPGCSRVVSDCDDDTRAQLEKIYQLNFDGVVFAGFTNMHDYGKWSDLIAYASELEKIDTFIGESIKVLGEDDVLLVVGNYGCSPITNKEAAEYVPVLGYMKNNNKKLNLKTVEPAYILKNLLTYYGAKKYPCTKLIDWWEN